MKRDNLDRVIILTGSLTQKVSEPVVLIQLSIKTTDEVTFLTDSSIKTTDDSIFLIDSSTKTMDESVELIDSSGFEVGGGTSEVPPPPIKYPLAPSSSTPARG